MKRTKLVGSKISVAVVMVVVMLLWHCSLYAETIDLATIEGDSLTVTALSSDTDYTNSSSTSKTLSLSLSSATSYSGTISGKIKLSVTMGAKATTLTLGGENTFTEGIEVMAGTLRVTRPEALGVGTVTLANNTKSVLMFGGSMTVSNPIVLNNYTRADYAATLIAESNCQVVLSGLVTSYQSWVESATGAVISFAGGINIASSELFCRHSGVISFAQTPITIPNGKTLKVSGNRALSTDRRVSVDVAGNDVSQINISDRGCLRIGVDGAFSNKPNLNMPLDGKEYERNGGCVDLHGHSADFGNISFEHGAKQSSFLVYNTSSDAAAFSFEQTSDETAAFVETSGPLDFVKRGTASFTITNGTFAVSGCVDVEAGTLRFTGVDGSRLAETVKVKGGATLDLGGHTVSCGTFLNMGGVVTNGTLAAATNLVFAAAGATTTISDDDLAVYYPLDRADRLCVDQSFHGNSDLLVQGSPECVASAKFGKSLKLNGSSALTNSVFPATLPTGNQAWSTCIFVKHQNYVSGNYHPIGWGAASGKNANFLSLTGHSRFQHIDFGDTALVGNLASGNFADGWHSVVLTYNPADNVRSMYFDGSLVASGEVLREGSAWPPNVTAKDFSIGGRHGNNNERNWEGWLDEAAVFRRTLTAEEVAAYHAHGTAGVVANPLGEAAYDGLVSEDGGVLRIAHAVTTPMLSGPGTVETWGMTVTERISGCPSVVGDVTLASGVEIAVSSLSDKEGVPLLRVSGGDLVCNGELKIVENGRTLDPASYRVYVSDGVLYGRRRPGFIIIFR